MKPTTIIAIGIGLIGSAIFNDLNNYYLNITLFVIGMVLTIRGVIDEIMLKEEDWDKKCHTCRYYMDYWEAVGIRNEPPLGFGRCRRNAPTKTYNLPEAFPTVGIDFWCGDHEPIKEKKP